jgi:hypothetical protein
MAVLLGMERERTIAARRSGPLSFYGNPLGTQRADIPAKKRQRRHL